MHRVIPIVFAVLFFPVMAVAQPSPLNAIDEHICLKCEDVVPAAIREKHLGGQSPAPEKHPQCAALCAFENNTISSVAVFCGRSDEEARTRKPVGTFTPLPDLEDNGHSLLFNGERLVQFTDKDTPCSVIVHANPKDTTSEAKAIALARDVAKVLTPEVVAKRRTVDAIVWAQDKSGKKAQAVLDAWKVEGAAIAKLGAFSAGLPQVLDHAGREGLPDGKKSLLLGYCPTGKGDDVIAYWKPIFPGLKSYRVSAQGAPLSCPVKAFEVDSQPSSRTAQVPDGELTVVSYVPTTKARHGRDMVVYASLRDKSARLVDSRYEQVFFDGYRLDKTKLQPSDAGMTIQVAYTMGPYPTCKKDPTRTKMITVGVADAKISIDASDVPAPTCLCCGGE